MHKNEYRAAIEAVGLTQVSAGDFLGIDPRTSRRYALGEPVPPPLAILLRYMARKKLRPQDIRPEWNNK